MTLYKATRNIFALASLVAIANGCTNNNGNPSLEQLIKVKSHAMSQKNSEFSYEEGPINSIISTNVKSGELYTSGFEINAVNTQTGAKFTFKDTCGDGPGLNPNSGSNNYLCGPDLVSFNNSIEKKFVSPIQYDHLEEHDRKFAKDFYKLTILTALDHMK